MESQQEPVDRNSGEASSPQEEVEEKSWIQKFKEKFLCGLQISLLISLIYYFAMFVVGIWGIKKCPVNDNIPFFLIVTGGIGWVSKTLSIVRKKIITQHPVAREHVESSFYTVETVFFILGSFWVFKVYKPSFDDGDGNNYCNKTVYMFALNYLSILYAFLLLALLIGCCFLGCICFMKPTEKNNDDPEAQTRPIRPVEAENKP